GVATVRNSRYLKEGYQIEHPFDCLGDLGAATAAVLVGLAARDLLFGATGTSAASSPKDYCSECTEIVKKLDLSF
ncbi:MAG: hypothetical protein GY820_05540, partial [Gammaproteobacteria bacterium]|nr:hypothetical protein [Gammaproteobacteria bacterium]